MSSTNAPRLLRTTAAVAAAATLATPVAAAPAAGAQTTGSIDQAAASVTGVIAHPEQLFGPFYVGSVLIGCVLTHSDDPNAHCFF